MDTKHVRIMRLCENMENARKIYVDESCLYSLRLKEGDEVTAAGKRIAKKVILALLPVCDHDAYVARCGSILCDEMMLDYGEEVLLYR